MQLCVVESHEVMAVEASWEGR